MDGEWRDAYGPNDTLLIGELFDCRRDYSRRTDAVAAHDYVLFLAALVKIGRAQRLTVFCAQLEDVADLDDLLDTQPLAAERACLVGFDPADIGQFSLEIISQDHSLVTVSYTHLTL